MTRLVLAATLGANYGIYGPAFELCENRRRDTVSEEYLNSEKYELKQWDIKSTGNGAGWTSPLRNWGLTTSRPIRCMTC